MKQRCLNPKATGYEIYGAKGVRVCREWMSFENFYKDMGRRPSRLHSVDRIDSNGNYEPGNCRWADKETQANNTERNIIVTFRGETMSLSQWSRELDVHVNTLHYWVRKKRK
jgi:hypothetical protein